MIKLKDLVKESFWSNSSEENEFLKNNNINKDKLVLLGHGENGYAYKLSSSKVLKITSDKKEVEIARKILQKNNLPGIVRIYSVVSIGRLGYIITEMLDIDSDIEDNWYNMQDILVKHFKDDHVSLVRELNLDLLKLNLEIDDELFKFMNSISIILESLRILNISNHDMHENNLGYRKDELVLFDISDISG